MEDPGAASLKHSKPAKKAPKTAKQKPEPRDAFPGISKSVSRKRVEQDQLDEAELGDKIEAIISPKTERAADPDPAPLQPIQPLQPPPKPKSLPRLAPMLFGSTDRAGEPGGGPGAPQPAQVQKSASLQWARGPAPQLPQSPEARSAPKPLAGVLSRLKAGSPLQAIKNVFKKRRRLG